MFILILTWLLGFPALSNSETTSSLPPCDVEIERLISRLDLDAADRRARQLRNPQLTLFYLHHSAFLRALLRPSIQARNQFEQRTEATEESTEDWPESDFKTLCYAEMYLERAILQVIADELWGAFWDLQSSYNYTQTLSKRLPNHPAAERFAGIFEVGFSAVPSRYKWALKILGLKGSLSKGIARLKVAASTESFLYRQNELILYFVYRNLMAAPETAGLRIAQRLKEDPTHVLWNYFLGYNALDLQQNEKAWKYLQTACSQPEAEGFPFAFLMAGRSALYRQDYALAIDWFRSFLNRYHGRLYRIDASFRIAFAEVQLGRNDQARSALQQALALPTPVIDEDRYARKQAESKLKHLFVNHEQTFFSIRYALDGGYYERARVQLDQLSGIESRLTVDDRTELHYRTARMHHLQDNNAAAFTAYRKAIALQPTSKLWMKVYSLLYLGQMYEKGKQTSLARQCFKQALAYDEYDYQSGLEQRALSGLRRLND